VRRRALASCVVAWHALVLLVAAAPAALPLGPLRALVGPYARLLLLEGHWSFFAPDPDPGRLVRYVVEDTDGRRHPFVLTEALDPADPAYWRLAVLYRRIRPEEPSVVASVAAYLCREHAPLAPRAITLVVLFRAPLRPETYVAGHRPLDPGFLRPLALPAVACHGGAGRVPTGARR
jgi:hypothetical protein